VDVETEGELMGGKRSGIIVMVLAAGLVAGAGCGDDDGDEDVQLPNPASVYCEEQGGTVELVEEEDGVVGYCELPDGTRIEEWELYRSRDG
jgi:uncharacterized protein